MLIGAQNKVQVGRDIEKAWLPKVTKVINEKKREAAGSPIDKPVRYHGYPSISSNKLSQFSVNKFCCKLHFHCRGPLFFTSFVVLLSTTLRTMH